MAFTEPLGVFLNSAEFAVPVVIGTGEAAVETTGIEDFRDVAAFDNAEVLVRQRTVLLTTSDAAGLSVGDTITVNGTARRVLAPPAQEDGAFSLVAIR